MSADPVSSILIDLSRDAESDLSRVRLCVFSGVMVHVVGMHALQDWLYVVALSSFSNLLTVHVHARDVDYFVLVLNRMHG